MTPVRAGKISDLFVDRYAYGAVHTMWCVEFITTISSVLENCICGSFRSGDRRYTFIRPQPVDGVLQPNPQGGFVYVDESGDPGLDPTQLQRRPYFVFGYVYVRDPADLNKRLKRLLKRLHLKDKYPPKLKELKFYIPYGWLINNGYTNTQCDAYVGNMPEIRKRVMGILVDHTDGVFAAVVDKRHAYDGWTPERLGNYTFAQTLMLGVMRKIKSDSQPAIIYDKGRLSQSREVSFDSYLLYKQAELARKYHIPHLLEPKSPHSASSIHHPGIWAADYVAGAFYHKYHAGDSVYADILKSIWFGTGEWLYWKRRTHGNPNRT